MNTPQLTSDRLRNIYSNFSATTLERVERFVDDQKRYKTFGDFLRAAGLSDNTIKPVSYEGYLPVEIADIRPPHYDEAEALVYDLPMANPFDANTLYQLAALATVLPNRRIIAAANPSGKGCTSGRLKYMQRREVIDESFIPVVEPSLKYLDGERIGCVQRVGYSYGADKALAAATYGDQKTTDAVLVEPSVRKFGRGILAAAKLGAAFKSTEKHLENYVRAANLPLFDAARADAAEHNNYALGLLRLTNLAVARGLARGDFGVSLGHALHSNPDMLTTLVWGSESELAVNGLMRQIANNNRRPELRTMVLPGQHHALFNDVPLQLAIILQGLQPSRLIGN